MINKYVPTEELSDTNTATKSIGTTTNTDSAVYHHEITTGHKIDWHNWSIISKDSTKSRLFIRESLHSKKEVSYETCIQGKNL